MVIVTLGTLGGNVALQTKAVSYLETNNKAKLLKSYLSSIYALFFFSSLASLILALLLILGYFSFERFISAVFGIILGITQIIFVLKTTIIRCNFEFDRFAQIMIFRASSLLILYLLISLRFDSYIVFILLEIFVMIFINLRIKLPISANFSYKQFFRNDIIGYIYTNKSIILLIVSSFLLISFERITGYFLLTNAQYAIIAFSAIFVSIGLNIQSMMSSYFFPLMAKRHLDEGNIALIKQGTFIPFLQS